MTKMNKTKFSRQNNLTNFLLVQASRLLENAGGTPAPQGANQSTYCDAAPKNPGSPNALVRVASCLDVPHADLRKWRWQGSGLPTCLGQPAKQQHADLPPIHGLPEGSIV